MIYLETSRLQLRDWAEADLEPFRRLNADKQVMRYFPKTLSPEETNVFYQSIATEFTERGYGLYAVEVKENKEFNQTLNHPKVEAGSPLKEHVLFHIKAVQEE
ncbi:GNAT family N-acetyltransferase [Paenibacillus dendritiformis]|uniref:GNAT family N-acetyltransferase n=1 Tax=Paenibacillus dendritiformis TaxID=130049 RepID=UPI00364CFA33